MGEVTFFSIYDDVASAEAGQRALDRDPGYPSCEEPVR
jgi:hypothetical protein